jgi:hypothetical protein
MSPMQALYAEFDGPIPAHRRRQAEAEERHWRARRAVKRTARVKVRARMRTEQVVARMAEAIVEIHERQGGQLSQDDLVRFGFTPDQVRAHAPAAKALAQPAMRALLAPEEMAA